MVLLILVLLSVLYISVRYSMKKPEGYPPGPPRLPIVGNLPFSLWEDRRWAHKAFKILGKRYKTGVLGMFFGSQPFVVANDAEAIKEMCFSQDFDGRPDSFFTRFRSFGHRFGVLFGDGDTWQHDRRLSIHLMRNFGMGRRHSEVEAVIQDELQHMVDICMNTTENFDGEKWPPRKDGRIHVATLFVLPQMKTFLRIITNRNLPRSMDAELREVANISFEMLKSTDETGGLMAVIPWIRHFFPLKSGYQWLKSGNGALVQCIKKTMETYNDGHAEGHFFGEYLSKTKEKMEKDGIKVDDATLEIRLIVMLTDYLLPTCGSVQVINFLIQHVLLQPHIQEKCQNEIDREIGRDRLPNADDRYRLPYTEACIREALRRETVLSLAVCHRSLKDTTLQGYHIPKDSIIAPNLWHLHMDEELWGDPENFRPERFLDSNGNISAKKDHSLPFGAGRRVCASESFSRQLMLLMFATMTQNFTLYQVDGLPDIEKTKIPGFAISRENFWVKAVPRTK